MPIESKVSTVGMSTSPGTAAAGSAGSPPKSPRKQSPMASANGARFSVGNLKPSSSRGTTRNNRRTYGNGSYTISTTISVAPVARMRAACRNRYRPSAVFRVRRNNREQNTSIDKAKMSKLLENARAAIEPPSQKILADRNFRTTTNKICKPGTRLLPPDQRQMNGRLPEQQLGNNTRFLTNGKRDIESEDQSTKEVASTRKKRRIN